MGTSGLGLPLTFVLMLLDATYKISGIGYQLPVIILFVLLLDQYNSAILNDGCFFDGLSMVAVGCCCTGECTYQLPGKIMYTSALRSSV